MVEDGERDFLVLEVDACVHRLAGPVEIVLGRVGATRPQSFGQEFADKLVQSAAILLLEALQLVETGPAISIVVRMVKTPAQARVRTRCSAMAAAKQAAPTRSVAVVA